MGHAVPARPIAGRRSPIQAPFDGIVMDQRALSPEHADDLLGRVGAATGSSLYEVATSSGLALADSPGDPGPARKRPGPQGRLRPVGPAEP